MSWRDGPVSARSLAAAALPVLAIVVFAGALLATVAVAGDTLGYDYLAYDAAARRLLTGEPIYDLSVQQSGGFGVYYYPPPFVLFVLPFAVLFPSDVAIWAWTTLLVAAFLVGVVAIPVRTTTRWLVVLLGGLMWPFLYAVKLGQVGPLLFLLFALGWRWLERDRELGVVTALGTLVKLQPAVVFLWAATQRRWAVLGWGAVVGLGAVALTVVIVGPGAFGDFVTLVRQVADPVSTPHNFTPGAVAYQLGAPVEVANAIQLSVMATVVLVVIAAGLWAPPLPGYLVAVVASQLLSPILWDHYAMLLLLPVAYLLDRGHWWAALVPLALSVVVVGVTPAIAYPICFGVMLVAPLVIRDERPDMAPAPA